ncbi:hypothetical protein CFC21_094751 [Triticum aestivum]|uniref:Uncharacterized protein n=2 Tax=Triticum aestivum TaxID=4565 RepID=A0A9R1MWR2_WHEAT|nr:uncharacterized protein LOC123146278 [Triticum aestivum]XP_044421838.1 uncharacterized protein LOC123146278 [Triticum aestivum]XP_044421839.1 uncharacterized protein LOC123146278 [Triticum aestivum]KAF7092245.1 hypothetical protein CFC21_094751 [Triticum aestivum]
MATVPSKPEPLSDVSDLNLHGSHAPATATLSGKPEPLLSDLNLQDKEAGLTNGLADSSDKNDKEAPSPEINSEESLEGDKVIDIGQKVLNALDDLPAADLAPFLACDDIEGNPNPWVQVEPRGRRQGAHTVAPVDNTGDVDGLGEQGVDEFEDVFWLTKIRQHRVSRRSTKSRPRALVGVRSGPGVFVFNY